MADPLGFINGPAATSAVWSRKAAPGGAAEGPSFKDVLLQNLNEANQAQQEATRAVEDLATGERADVENVILAANKADTAFRMLQSLRNRMIEAYDEIKQIRV